MRRSVVTGRTVYEDARVTLSTTSVTFRGYWLPFALSRTLRLDRLTEAVEYHRGDPELPRWPWWGRGAQGCWFPLELTRTRRDTAVALSLVEGQRIVVTPANPARFLALLVDLGVPVSKLEPEPNQD